MKKEFHRQLGRRDNPGQIDFLSFRMRTKKGKIIEVEDSARKARNSFYGDLYYVYLYAKKDKIKMTDEGHGIE